LEKSWKFASGSLFTSEKFAKRKNHRREVQRNVQIFVKYFSQVFALVKVNEKFSNTHGECFSMISSDSDVMKSLKSLVTDF
jgi:hypothetical protein